MSDNKQCHNYSIYRRCEVIAKQNYPQIDYHRPYIFGFIFKNLTRYYFRISSKFYHYLFATKKDFTKT